jgi:hypothetical protein
MAADVGKIKVVNPYTVRQVIPKRDHESKKDYPHQDANGFAKELTEKRDDAAKHLPKPDSAPEEAPAEEPPEQEQSAQGHLDVEA